MSTANADTMLGIDSWSSDEGTNSGTVVLVGTFDLLNVRHLDLVEKARSNSGTLTLAVLSDEAIADLMGRAPAAPVFERAMIAGHIRGVDRIVTTGPTTNWRLPAHDVLLFDGHLTGLGSEDIPWPEAELLEAGTRSHSAAVGAADYGFAKAPSG
jgi:hypothetical protein